MELVSNYQVGRFIIAQGNSRSLGYDMLNFLIQYSPDIEGYSIGFYSQAKIGVRVQVPYNVTQPMYASTIFYIWSDIYKELSKNDNQRWR